MIIPTPLNTEAENCREALVRWIAQSQPGADYVRDEKGNRIYSKQKMAPFVEPLLQAIGLSRLGYTMWRYSAYSLIHPDPPTELYIIPIEIISGQPQIIKDGRQNQIVPGWYTVTIGAFEVTPQFDCLLAADISKAQET